jgi:Tol biopolymer transport system component
MLFRICVIALCSAISSVLVVLSPLARLLPLSSAEPTVPGSKGVEAHRRQPSTGHPGPAPNEPLRAQSAALPSNLEVSPVFEPFLKAMWQSSRTFRRQCRRLAAETGVRAKLLVDDSTGMAQTSRAWTVFNYHNGSLVSAQLYLKPDLITPELIAHEMEHVLEQLDRVDLEAQAGNGVVWKSDKGRFETRRAIEIGQRVSREMAGGSDVKEVPDRSSGDSAERLRTMAQRNRDATPFSMRSARVSASGRHIVFVSLAQLVEADRNQFPDVYVLDLASGHVTLESVGPAAAPSNGWSSSPDISTDGRYVVFESVAGNLTSGPFQPGSSQVFLRDRKQSLTRLVTSDAAGNPANGVNRNPAISAEGRAVVWESTASDVLGSGRMSLNSFGIYMMWLTSGRRARVDLPNEGGLGASNSASPAISADGRFVAFRSQTDLVCGAASACRENQSVRNGVADIYVRDNQTNTLRRITRSYAGGDSDARSYDPAISGNGRYVAFASEATNLTRDTRTGRAHVYLHDLLAGTTEIISRTRSGRPANGASLGPALSHDASRIAFQSLASDLLCNDQCEAGQADINLLWDVFVYDRSTRRMTRASAGDGEEWMENSRAPSLDNSGRVLAFGSRHPINERDEGHDEDLYVYRLR